MSQHDRLADSCAKYVIHDLQSLDFVESPHLKLMLEGIADNGREIDMPSRDSLKKRLFEMKKDAVEAIRSALKGKQPALTCDIWTSDVEIPYLNISCRYIEEKDDTCKLVSCLLSCDVLYEYEFPVPGETIAEKIKLTMKTFGIEETAVSVTTGAHKTMQDAVTNHLPDKIWQACAAQRIELAIRPVTEEESIRETVELHNEVVSHVKFSPKIREKLDRLQKEATGKIITLPRSGITFWGSVFDQAKVMLEHKASLETVLEPDNDAPDSGGGSDDESVAFEEVDWTNTKFYHDVLAGFAGAVGLLQSDHFLTNGMMPMLCAALRPVIRARATNPTTTTTATTAAATTGPSLPDNLKEAAEEMFDNLKGQFEGPSDAEKIAAYLDVRCKRLGWASGSEAASYREATKVAAMKVCEVDARREEEGGGGGREADDDNSEIEEMEEEEEELDEDEEDVRAAKRKRKARNSCIMFASMLKRHSAAAVARRAQPDDAPAVPPSTLERKLRVARAELEYYETEMPLPAQSSPQDVLDWWFAHKGTFPTLYRVACVYLAIPATTPETTRAFAKYKDTTTLKRNGLEEEEVDALVFLHGCQGVGWKGAED